MTDDFNPLIKIAHDAVVAAGSAFERRASDAGALYEKAVKAWSAANDKYNDYDNADKVQFDLGVSVPLYAMQATLAGQTLVEARGAAESLIEAVDAAYKMFQPTPWMTQNKPKFDFWKQRASLIASYPGADSSKVPDWDKVAGCAPGAFWTQDAGSGAFLLLAILAAAVALLRRK
jgi:hypothetical protein